MKSLREEGAKNPDIKDQWTDCVQDPISLLTTVFERLSWKENELKVNHQDHQSIYNHTLIYMYIHNSIDILLLCQSDLNAFYLFFIFQIISAAADDEIDKVVSILKSNLDESITAEDKKAVLRHRPQMSSFLDSHVVQTKYFLSIKKCAGPCEWCAERRLSEEVFSNLHHIPIPIIDVGGDHYKKFEVSGVQNSNLFHHGMNGFLNH